MSALRIEVIGIAELVAKFAGLADLRGGAVVGTDLNYARYVSEGTGPHRIEAHGGGLFWPGAAHPVRAVNHPGTKANTYVEDAVASAGPQIVALLGAKIQTMIEGGGGGFQAALYAGALLAQAEVQRGAPVKTGNLRRSWHTEVQS